MVKNSGRKYRKTMLRLNAVYELKNSLEYAFIKRPIKNEKSSTQPSVSKGKRMQLTFYSRFDKTQNDSQQYRPL